jgi:beta-glucanase (GH16 family)
MTKGLYILLSISIFTITITSCKKKPDAPTPSPIDTMNYDMDEAAVINAGWTKTLDEQFSTDLSNWNIWEGGAYNNEYQCYTNASNNITLTNGALIITAIAETVTGSTTNSNATQKTFGFTSARIEHKTTITANANTPKVRYSARIKLPAGYGMWPAFWSYGAAWPTNGEIDAMEAKGNLPMQYGTNYFYGSTAGTNQVSGAEATIHATKSLVQYWHVYEVIWEETKLTYMLDGKIVKTLTTTTTSGQFIDDMYGKTQNIVVNLAVGGDYFGNPAASTIVTGTMYVDWVKVFTSN